MTHLSRLVLALLAAVATQLAWGAAEPPGPTDIKPGPAVAQFAAEHGLPVDGFELAGASEPDTPSDRVTVLFTIMEGGKSRQWLSEFSSVSLTAREAKSKPDAGLGILSWVLRSLHSETGHTYRFEQSPAALAIRTFGPFDGPNRVKETDDRMLATREYLDQGLAPMCEIEMRLREAGRKDPGMWFTIFDNFSDEQKSAAVQRARAAGFTESDERVFAEGALALVQFGAMALKTPGTSGFMGEMFDPPPVFSGSSVNFDWSKLQLQDSRDWGLPSIRMFSVPYYFQSKTKAGGLLFITAPRPPLQNTAGIVGLTVDWSSKAPGRRLIARVLAGQRGRP